MIEFDSFGLEDKLTLSLASKDFYFLTGPLTVENCSLVVKWIINENISVKKQKVLTLVVNSEGGDLYQAFSIVDAIKSSNHIIRTIGIGQVMSAAFLIFASGAKGQRLIAENTSLMCHQYSSELGNVKHHDLQAAVSEGNICDDKMLKILVESTSLSKDQVHKKLLNSTDVYLDAKTAIVLGVADSILEKFT
jgi:ATP-dependent protease ClpP protease subunit